MKSAFGQRNMALGLAVCLMLASCTSEKESADLLLLGGRVYTVDSAMTVVEAVAVRAGRIVAVGSRAELSARFEAKAQLDLQGKAVYPGFYDPHCHFYGFGMNMLECDLVGTQSYEEVVSRVVDFAKRNPHADWILGRGWDQNDWADQSFPTRDTLDALFPDRPILLKRIDGHAALVNGAALQKADLGASTSVLGGQVLKGADGEPTGVLIDNAINLVEARVPQPDQQAQLAALQRAEKACLAVGLTSVVDAGLGRQVIATIKQAYQDQALKIRSYLMATPDDLPYFVAAGFIEMERLKVKSFKLYADGALGSRGAALLSPYSDAPDQYGLLLRSPQELDSLIGSMYQHGWQINTHCIGDSANRLILNLYAKHLQGGNDRRWRIEHAQVVHPDDLSKFGQYGVIPSVQATHATSDMYWAGDRLGEDRLASAYAYRELLEAAGLLVNGSDFPVEAINPLFGFHAAVARRDASGWPKEGFQPENALSREQALKAMTIWAAYSCFEEKEKGSIEPGKLADFTILEQDIMQIPIADTRNVQVSHTLINGEIVYARQTTQKN